MKKISELDMTKKYGYYVVKYGIIPGIYVSVEEFLEQVMDYPDPEFWACNTIEQAELYLYPKNAMLWRLTPEEIKACNVPSYQVQQQKVVGVNQSGKRLLPIHERVRATPPAIIIPDTFL